MQMIRACAQQSPGGKPPLQGHDSHMVGTRRGPSAVAGVPRVGGWALALCAVAMPAGVLAQELPSSDEPGAVPFQARETTRSWYVGLHAGLLGPGVTVGGDLSRRLALRGQIQSYDHETDRSYAGIDYQAELAWSSRGLFLDWHPRGSFRLTLGGVSNDNEVRGFASEDALQIGERRYDAELNARVTFEPLSPYAGLGWSTGRGRRGLGVTFDLGVMMQGEPAVSASGTVGTTLNGVQVRCGMSVDELGAVAVTGNSPACDELLHLRDDLMQEHSELVEDLEEFDLYPVVAFGLVYRF